MAHRAENAVSFAYVATKPNGFGCDAADASICLFGLISVGTTHGRPVTGRFGLSSGYAEISSMFLPISMLQRQSSKALTIIEN